MRIALYARVSTQDQHLEAQLAPLREYAARRGAEPVEFVDHAVSGSCRSRKGLNALVGAARRREIDAVAVVRLDRVARSLAHLAQLGEELHALGVELVSLTEGIDTTTPTGKALFGLCGVFGQLERDLAVERTRAGLAAARREGSASVVPGRSAVSRWPERVGSPSGRRPYARSPRRSVSRSRQCTGRFAVEVGGGDDCGAVCVEGGGTPEASLLGEPDAAE